MTARNNTLDILIPLTAAVYVLMIIFNGLGGAGYTGLFDQSIGDVSNKYYLYITPAGWTFGIWSCIYILLGAMIVYCVSTMYRVNANGYMVYVDPMTLSPLFYILLIFNFLMNVFWVFAWNNEYIVAGSLCLVFVSYSGWTAIGFAVFRASRVLEVNDIKLIYPELRLQRIFVHNCLAIYITWTSIATMLNFDASFRYFGQFDAEIVTVVCCTIFLILLVGWFVLENTVLETVFDIRYTLSQYPVIIFGFGGIVDRQRHALPTEEIPKSVIVLSWILLGVSVILFIARMVIVSYKYRLHSPPVNTSHNKLRKHHDEFRRDQFNILIQDQDSLTNCTEFDQLNESHQQGTFTTV